MARDDRENLAALLHAKLGKKQRLDASTSMRIPLDLLAQIDGIAKDTGRSRNEVLVAMMEVAADAYDRGALVLPRGKVTERNEPKGKKAKK